MKLRNKNYDFTKWVVLIFLPALAFLVSGIVEIYNWTHITNNLVATINLLTVFLGSLLQISTYKYNTTLNTEGGMRIDSDYTKTRKILLRNNPGR